MRMTIEDTINTFRHIRNHPKTDEEEVIKFGQELFDTAIDTMRKYQMMQADYENRLKADMVAMLTEIQLEIEEMQSRETWCDYATDNCICRYEVTDFIQQKINSLKAEIKPKTGHWKQYLKDGLRYQCSACDSRFDTPWEYCPHCGAKMIKPQESTI